MFDPRLYREACRELKAPEDKIEEVIAMTENTNKRKRHPLRAALICVAAAAMMVVGVSAANPDVVANFAGHLADIIQVNRYRMELTTEDGMKITVFSAPRASVENRDGRAILVIDGEDAADITAELNAEGRFCYESVTEEGLLTVTVEGTAEKWTALVTIGDPGSGPVYTYSSDDEGDGFSIAPTAPAAFSKSMDGVDVYVSINEYDGEALDGVGITTNTIEHEGGAWNDIEISVGTAEYNAEIGTYTYTHEG